MNRISVVLRNGMVGHINLPDVFKGDLVSEAQDDLVLHLEEGTVCFCCGQSVKLYPRFLNSTMARGLMWLTNEYLATNDWVDKARIGPAWIQKCGGEFAKLEWWDLIEPKPNDDTKKRTSGIWRPTNKGIDFVYNRIYVRSPVLLYNNELFGFGGNKITIVDALTKDFDYNVLMKGYRNL